MTGEGTLARIMVGQDDDGQVWIGVARPQSREGSTNPHVVNIGKPASLSLSFHKLESIAQCVVVGDLPLEGCRPRKGQRGLTITIADAPEQRLYWNAVVKRFTVWVP